MAFVGVASASAAIAQPPASSPAANAVLGAPPARVVIATPGSGPGSVVASTPVHQAAAAAPARPAGGALVAPLPHLPRGAGIYSVVWHAGGAGGSFAFQVSPGGTSPA